MIEIITLIEQNKDILTRDELHFISKHIDEIIVKKYIKKGGKENGNA